MALTFYLLLNEFRMVQPMLKKEKKKKNQCLKAVLFQDFAITRN